MHVARCSLGQSYFVQELKAQAPPKRAVAFHGCVPWVTHERREYSVSVVMAAGPARREDVLCYVML